MSRGVRVEDRRFNPRPTGSSPSPNPRLGLLRPRCMVSPVGGMNVRRLFSIITRGRMRGIPAMTPIWLIGYPSFLNRIAMRSLLPSTPRRKVRISVRVRRSRRMSIYTARRVGIATRRVASIRNV